MLIAFLVGRDPARHHPAAARRPDALHLALRHRRLHGGRERPAGARPDEEPARPAAPWATCTTTSSYRFWLTLVAGRRHPRARRLPSGSARSRWSSALRWLKDRIGWRLLPEFLIVVVVMAALVGVARARRAGRQGGRRDPGEAAALRAARARRRRDPRVLDRARWRSRCSACSRRSRWPRRSRRRPARSST